MEPATSADERHKWMQEFDYMAASKLFNINVIILEMFQPKDKRKQRKNNPYWEIQSRTKSKNIQYYLKIILKF